jgi:hypothetical protein
MSDSEDPRKYLDTMKISAENLATVEALMKKYPATSDLREHYMHIFPDHDKLQFKVIWLDNPKHLLYDYIFLLNGLIIRSKELCEATLREIFRENMPASASLLRSQLETLACAVYIERNPERLNDILKGSGDKRINILTQIEHAEKKHKKLRGDYDALSDLVHPNSSSHFSAVQPLGMQEKALKIRIAPVGYLSEKDAVSMIRLNAVWTMWALKAIEAINEHFKKLPG